MFELLSQESALKVHILCILLCLCLLCPFQHNPVTPVLFFALPTVNQQKCFTAVFYLCFLEQQFNFIGSVIRNFISKNPIHIGGELFSTKILKSVI